jgi:hypothetical protein
MTPMDHRDLHRSAASGADGPVVPHAVELTTGPKLNQIATAVITMMTPTRIRTLMANLGAVIPLPFLPQNGSSSLNRLGTTATSFC